MTAYTIGIDIGTGSTKAIAIDHTGKTLFSTQVSYPTLSPKPGYSEQAPELLWQAFVKCITRTITNFGVQPDSISISAAMHSLICVNELGAPLMNMITWADNRSAGIAEDIKHSNIAEILYKQTGTPIHAMSPLCKIIWLKDNEPELFHKTHKFISIKEFIWHKLFEVFEVDHSIASATGLFGIETLRWNSNALVLAGITEDKLSIPVRTDHRRSDLRKNKFDLVESTSTTFFFIGASDGCLANLGSFAIDPGIAALTIGTSGAIRVGNRKPTFNFGAMTFNYILDENTFISGGPVNNGGVALKWFIESALNKTLTSAADYSEILSQAEDITPGCDGLIFLPYILGERAPLWNSHARGMFFGITSQHSHGYLIRAVIEGITMALYHVATALENGGLALEQINVSGGFVHSKIWLQILADMFNKKVCLINAEDASAIGAAYLALKSLGIIDTYDQLKPNEVITFYPNPERHKVYLKNFEIYKKIYINLKDVM